jgi:hypothetical protein
MANDPKGDPAGEKASPEEYQRTDQLEMVDVEKLKELLKGTKLGEPVKLKTKLGALFSVTKLSNTGWQ